MAAPTISQVTETYQGISILCARIVCTEACAYKFDKVVNAEDDYLFQLVARTSSGTKQLTVTVGDNVDTLDINATFDRYVMHFPSVTIATNESLYIDFPAGTYYLYNLQLERGTVATKWQPAPEDAAAYADDAAQAAVDAQTQQDIFNTLTNNGQTQGIYLQNGKLYLNASYMATGTLDASTVTVSNLVADHLRSYGNSNTWMLDSQASYLDIRQLVSSIWKQRVGIYISSSAGAIRVSSGDVDANGTPLSGASLRSFVQPDAIWIGMDKDGNNTGALYAGSASFSGAISGASLTTTGNVAASGNVSGVNGNFTYVNANTIGVEKASNNLTTVNATWSFNVTGTRFLLVTGQTGRMERYSTVIPVGPLTSAATYYGWTDSTGTTQFTISKSSSTVTIKLTAIPSGGKLISAYSLI